MCLLHRRTPTIQRQIPWLIFVFIARAIKNFYEKSREPRKKNTNKSNRTNEKKNEEKQNQFLYLKKNRT